VACPDPLLVVSDGAPGVIRAIEECFPRSARQRCLVHKMRNLQSKVPETAWPEFKGAGPIVLPGGVAGARAHAA
jgi:transposase-like protein